MVAIVIVGGGPSGMAAAYEAVAHGARVVVLERLDRVGGLARTLDFQGSRFDIGPHRFFTRNAEINALFESVVGEDLIRVPRLTRIFYNNSYFNYPLTPLNALSGLGVFRGTKILSSYFAALGKRVFNATPIETFEDSIIDMFGWQLYETFFKTYTQKVWGISCNQISADWASQRIKGLSLGAAISNALFRPKRQTIKTLVDEFAYPRRGAGQTYEKMADHVGRSGSSVLTGADVVRIRREGRRVRAAVLSDGREVEGDWFLVSAPLTRTIDMMEPGAPSEVLRAARSLRYRTHVGVNLLLEGRPFPDNWIYVHAKEVALARVANYANFSPDMASRPGLSPITVEYFAFSGDELSQLTDDQLIERATRELGLMKIAQRDQIAGGFVVRSSDAYPVMETGYAGHVAAIKDWLDRLENLLPIGRSGMFKYNNQDHAMATGRLAARTALGIHRYDPWLVNIDASYHEGAPAVS